MYIITKRTSKNKQSNWSTHLTVITHTGTMTGSYWSFLHKQSQFCNRLQCFFFNINTVCDRGPKSSLCSYVGIAAGMPVRTCFNDTGHSTGTPAHHGSIHIVNPPPPLQFIQATHACMHSFTGLWSIQTLQRYFSQRRKLGRPHKHASATHTTYARTLSTGHLLRLQWPPTSSPMCTP